MNIDELNLDHQEQREKRDQGTKQTFIQYVRGLEQGEQGKRIKTLESALEGCLEMCRSLVDAVGDDEHGTYQQIILEAQTALENKQ